MAKEPPCDASMHAIENPGIRNNICGRDEIAGFLFCFVFFSCNLFSVQYLFHSEIYTLSGNSFGSPCVFPFKYNNTWHHECVRDSREDGYPWCATTSQYERDEKWGICPNSGKWWCSLIKLANHMLSVK